MTHEQEESVRKVQRSIRENKEAWAEQRLLSLLSVHVERLHMGLRGCACQTEARWNNLCNALKPNKMIAYLGWVQRNRERLQQVRLEESVIQATALCLDERRNRIHHNQARRHVSMISASIQSVCVFLKAFLVSISSAEW